MPGEKANPAIYLIEWLTAHVKQRDGESWNDFMQRRREGAEEFRKLYPDAPARPPQPAHEPATTDKKTYRGKRRRK